MYRKFIGTVAAASIALTAFGAAPARADDEDVARALAAILGIAVLGAIINDNKKDNHVVTRQHTQPRAHKPHRPRHTYQQPRHVKPRHVQPRHVQPRLQPKPLPRHIKPRQANNKLLPGTCFRTFETRRGAYRGFARGCLSKTYRHAHRLPQRCLVNLRTNRGHRSVYEARCLRNAGYRLARL